MTLTEDEVREVAAIVDRIEAALLGVLTDHTRLHDEPPRFSRAVGIYCLIDLAGRLMQAEVGERGEAARTPFVAMVQQLELLIMPKATTGTH